MLKISKVIIFSLFLILLVIQQPGFSNASKIDELKNQIEERNSNMSELEKEIEMYQKQLEEVGAEKQTLNNEIYRLNLNKKKLSSDISLTNNKISSTNLNIEKLGMEIVGKEDIIKNNTKALEETMRMINELDASSLVEIILSTNNISEFWDNIEEIQRFQSGIRNKTAELKEIKTKLEENKKETEEGKRVLVSLKSELSDQEKIVVYNAKEKDQLLSATKNKESNYKTILSEKERLMEEFAKEISDLESQLKIEIDPNSIPDSGYGVLSWPLDSVRITQYFGKTEFSTKNPQVYNGKGHTGIDFGASSGTKVKAALSGVVEGVGNTDTIPAKCYSYGKWVLIRHSNGLSTLYGHLSLIKVASGQTVNTGDIIGYSGNTGYSTGPHLHFSVYASAGVQIKQFTNSINCKDKFIPLAPYNAYLNPLSYLPKY